MIRRRVNEYDILKAFAIILVVIGHITILFAPANYPLLDVKLAKYITFGIYLFHMPLFMSISGAVYQLSKSKPKYQYFGSFVINKLKRLIVPYFMVGLFALLPILVYLNAENNWNDISTYNKILLAEDCRHLWYLLALFWIFIFQFIADKLNSNLWVLFVFSSVLTLLVSWFLPDLHFMCIEMGLRMWPCFILGMIMVRDSDRYPFIKSLAVCIIGGAVATIAIVLSDNYYIDMIFSLLLPFFICLALIVMARQLTLSRRWQTIVREIAGYSFGIYLFHVMVIYMLRHWLDSILEMWVLMGLMFIVSIAVSIGITFLLRKIKFGFVIGE